MYSRTVSYTHLDVYKRQVQGRPPRSPGRVLLRRRFASSGRTGLRSGQCYDITEQSTCLSNVPEGSGM